MAFIFLKGACAKRLRQLLFAVLTVLIVYIEVISGDSGDLAPITLQGDVITGWMYYLRVIDVRDMRVLVIVGQGGAHVGPVPVFSPVPYCEMYSGVFTGSHIAVLMCGSLVK